MLKDIDKLKIKRGYRNSCFREGLETLKQRKDIIIREEAVHSLPLSFRGTFIQIIHLPDCTGHVQEEMDDVAYGAQPIVMLWGPIMGPDGLFYFAYI